jgi:hypothetical protein
MDEKTAELRDIFIDTTGSTSVTENQEETRGSLASEQEDVTERVLELVATMRDRYEFESELDDETLLEVVRGYYDGESDAALAASLEVTEGAVFRARMDLHLVREADRDAPFDLERLRSLIARDADAAECAAELGCDVDVVRRYRAVVETETEATRANDRFRDEFEELLTDSELSGQYVHDAREDGLREATEDIETDVSF